MQGNVTVCDIKGHQSMEKLDVSHCSNVLYCSGFIVIVTQAEKGIQVSYSRKRQTNIR